MVLKFCANRVMAMQELQATGTMAAGFRDTGCYSCQGRMENCPYYTPMAWVYETEDGIPPQIRALIRTEPRQGKGKGRGSD